MKVLLVTEVFPPRLGGDGIHVMELALHLQKMGVEVSVLTKALESSSDFPFKVKRVGLKRNDLLGRLSFIFCALFSRPKTDIIHVHAAVGGLIGRFYKFLWKMPVVVTVHTIWGGSLSSTRARGVGRFLQWAEKRIFTSDFDYYITVTQEIADKLGVWGLKNVSFIPNGVNTEKFSLVTKKNMLRRKMGFGNGKILLFVGRLVKQKNVGLLLDSFRLFLSKSPGAKLLIAGSGPEGVGLRKKALTLGIRDNVVFLGPVDYDSLPPYYQVSDCLVLTSRWEGLPLCALEALSVGIPVVGTRVGGLAEVVKDGYNGYLAESSPENVSDKLLLAVGGGSVVRRNARRMAQKYGWERISRKTSSIYRKISR